METKKLVFLVLAAVLFTSLGAAYVGTAPGVQDLGKLEPGGTYEAYFYVLTDRSEPFLIKPSYTRPHTSILTEGKKTRYDFNPKKASEEDISSWVTIQDTYQVDPSNVQIIQLDNGGVARANQKVEFELTIPRNAEPGYHAGAINLNPKFSASASGTTSVQTVGVTQFVFVFYVDRDKPPTEPIRDLKILGVNSLRVSEDKVRVDFLMKNNGTVTTRVQRAKTMIYNQVGNKTGKIVVGGEYLAPGNTRIVQTYWKDQNIDPGTYRVEGQMSYITGSAYIDDTINVSEMVEIQSGPQTGDEGGKVPYWMVIMVLVLLGAMMYYFDLDPVWVLLLLGIVGISLYIVLTGLPNYLLGLLLLLSGAVLIYG
ncbi:MAG: hypothetical protein ABEJ69_02110 [Candidatus Nanohaloarchaea archaeon]